MDDERKPMVRAKAVIVDAGGDVVWSPEATAGPSLDELLPMAQSLGVRQAIETVARSGEAQHLSTPLVSTVRGSLAMAVSLFRLPDGNVLVLSDNSWSPDRGPRPGGQGPPRRRR